MRRAKPHKTKRSHASGRYRAATATLQLIAIPGLPEVHKGDDPAALIMKVAHRANISFQNGDILVIAQKIVSKAEGQCVRLSDVKPLVRATRLAVKLNKDPRFIEVILRESRRIVRSAPVLIVETRHGFVCANAGVDHSNVAGDDAVTLLPRRPDHSARRIAAQLRTCTGKNIAVIISDTFGRPWRLGLTNVAIGAAGLRVMLDLRGTRDRHGKPLTATILAIADDLAAAAGLLMGKSEGIPVVIVRGYRYSPANDPAARIIRPAREDLFR